MNWSYVFLSGTIELLTPRRRRRNRGNRGAAINAGRRYVRANGTAHLGPPQSFTGDCRDIAATATRSYRRIRTIFTTD